MSKQSILYVFCALTLIVISGLAFYRLSADQVPDDVADLTPVSKPSVKVAPLPEPTAQAAIPTSTQSESDANAPSAVDDGERVVSAERQTADPNDEPDNALAGISYRDVEMWELENLGIPLKLKGGVLISKIHGKSSFAEAQVEPGDIVTRAHHTKVVSFTDLENAVKDRTHTMLDVYRNGKAYQVVLNRPFQP